MPLQSDEGFSPILTVILHYYINLVEQNKAVTAELLKISAETALLKIALLRQDS